ncbi:MAG: hypothetical protein COU47_01910 [Candidatus Niyogibacteria bacterium CG10_big_fil_rev_8_21_14_0_10_46_36]|uniref:Thioredoxin domain-containing protein n=1 Tax=Candidatus Niyogibacteria bacterium CG10_big_fil_rev_8_21_14_0_10_46_36 TaxID=1974726 RepID=A0A2H0TDK1_9BACT|nr:MAG: hypothetical protein COU47_01910 [Candidatus Niyogibacteria bacterium CG10_big_fil_rev_8_21_14_0_10_46_36]
MKALPMFFVMACASIFFFCGSDLEDVSAAGVMNASIGADTPTLVEFYGDGCYYCDVVAPYITKLKEEEGIHIEKIEVWHNEENAKIWERYNARCGVPLFVNMKTGDTLCGAVPYEKLKAWAKESLEKTK